MKVKEENASKPNDGPPNETPLSEAPKTSSEGSERKPAVDSAEPKDNGRTSRKPRPNVGGTKDGSAGDGKGRKGPKDEGGNAGDGNRAKQAGNAKGRARSTPAKAKKYYGNSLYGEWR